MSTIQFGGVVSGLNTQSIISALVTAESQPLTAMQAQEASLTAKQSAYTSLGTSIDSVVTALKAFTVSSAGASRVANSSDNSVFTATASANASVSQYQVAVQRLASATVATSTGAIGSAVTGTVDTSLTLANANLATPITKGNMTLTVDGTAVQVAVGDPSTTTLQSVMNSLSSALQTQLQTTDAGSTVNASIVNGQLQLSISGNSAAHTISFGAQTGNPADTSNLAAALGLKNQGVTNGQNATVTGTAYLDPTLQSLNLPGSVNAGQISAVVDGVIVHYTVGDPTKTTLDQLMQGFGQAIQGQLQAGGNGHAADPTATATFSVVNNRLQLSVAGATGAHSLSFGASSDTSNALGMLGIANTSATAADNPTLTGDTNLGVTRMVSSLDSAGIAGLTSTTTGVLTINGVAISYDTTKDSLSTVVGRINNASAGVIASIDRTDDEIVLTKQDTGAVAIDIADTSGNLGASLKLAPGTTNAQQIGQTAQLTVNGKSITSTSNTVTNAIDGVTLSLVGKTPIDETSETLSVGVDTSGVQTALNTFITSFNSLGNTLDQLTQNTPGQSGGTAGSAGPLGDDPTALTMFLNLRATVFQTFGSGSTNSMGAIGVNTGAVGAAVGTTTRLQLDTTQLTTALTNDPNAVANLLDNASGPLGTLLTQLQNFEDPTNKSAYVQSNTTSLSGQISDLKNREADEQEMINQYQTMIEAQFTAMETTLATLQSQSAQIAAELGYSTSSSSSSSGLTASSTSGTSSSGS
jgi:flagellar hook-associated protein 2